MSHVIDGHTKLCGVIGDPIAHTLSPAIHNYLADAMGVNMTYMPLHVKAEQLQEAIKGAYGLHIQGMNVTVPHKQAVMDSLAHIDEGALAIGAVNTLVRKEDGYHGYNTDWIGLGRALRDQSISLEGKEVIILGAGGAAQAVAYLCGYEKATKVTILNRTLANATTLAKKMDALFADTAFCGLETKAWTTLDGEGYVCIQTTSWGMVPNDGKAVIEDMDFYKKLSAGVDIVYKPRVTKFMELTKAAGAKTCNGILMLLYQAVEAFELMNDVKVTKEAVAGIKMQLEEKFSNEA